MSTIIDSLLVTLGLDSKPYEQATAKVEESLDSLGDKSDATQDRMDKAGQRTRDGMKNTGAESERMGRKVEEGGKRGASGVESLTKTMAQFLALIGGSVAIKRFVEQTTAANASLHRLGLNLNEDVANISAFGNEVELAGGETAGLTGTLDMLSRAQTEVQLTGESGLIPYLSALGVGLTETNGKARSTIDILLGLSERFERMDRTTANNMGRMMGIDQGTMNLLLMGRKEVELLIQRQQEYRAVTAAQAEQSLRLNRAIGDNRQTFAALGRELLHNASPALERVFGWLRDIGEWLLRNSESVGTFLSVLAGGLVAVGAAAIPISATAASIIALAGAIALLKNDYDAWKEGGDSLINWQKWQPEIENAKSLIQSLGDVMYSTFYRAAAAGDMLASMAAIATNRSQGLDTTEAYDRLGYASGEFLNGPGARQRAPAASGGITPDDQAMYEIRAGEYFMQQGWSAEQAAGIVANLKRESGFDPAASGDGGNAYGLAQWHPDRQADFQQQFGKPLQGSSFEEQLAFIQHELTKGKEAQAGSYLGSALDAGAAGAIMSEFYERPADGAAEASIRAGMAVESLKRLLEWSITPGPASAPAMPDPGQGGSALPGPLGFVPGAAMGVQRGGREVAGNSSTTQIHIGEIKVTTAATDADGIARDLGRSMSYLFTGQANSGMVA